MSVVGPRPVSVAIFQIRERELPTYKERLQIMPGITGLVQIKGREWHHKKSLRYAHKLNMFYAEHQSLSFDFWIICQTPRVMLNLMGR